MKLFRLNRRSLLAAPALSLLPAAALLAQKSELVREKKIPKSGESLGVIGLGTSGVFDTEINDQTMAPRLEILELMHQSGAAMIDTSPMYGSAEQVVGVALSRASLAKSMFLATKVWTEGKDAGLRQMARSARLLDVDVIDLMQVHNLVDVDAQLDSIEQLKEQGKVRYAGITHYRTSQFDALMKVMEKRDIDFVQLNFSIATTDAEERILPMARDKGIAVIANRSFENGDLFRLTKGKPLPEFSHELGINSWGQFFLKFVISHPSVNVVIPGTSKPRHMLDNIGAGIGEMPDEKTRQRMRKVLESI